MQRHCNIMAFLPSLWEASGGGSTPAAGGPGGGGVPLIAGGGMPYGRWV